MAFRVTTPPSIFAGAASFFSASGISSYRASCVGTDGDNGGSTYIPPPPSSHGNGSGTGGAGGPRNPSDDAAPIDRQVYDRLISLIQLPPTITPVTRLTPNSIAFRGWLKGKEISLKNGREFTVTYVDNYLHSIAVFIDAIGLATWTSAAHFDARRSAAEKVLKRGNEARSLVQGYNAINQAIRIMRGVAEHLCMASEFTLFTKNYPHIDDAIIASSLAFDRTVAGIASLTALHLPTHAAAARVQRALIAVVRNEPAFLTLRPLCDEIAQEWACIEQSGTLRR